MMICDFEAGETLYTVGLSMTNKKVVCRVKFVRVNEDGRVVTRSHGINVIGGLAGEYFKTVADCKASIK